MYEPVKFKRLKEIAAELNRKLVELSDGRLSKNELENLTEESRELYERLVVLRFKAFQDEVNGPSTQVEEKPAAVETVATVAPVKDEQPTIEPIAFRIDNIEKTDNGTQVSLIDAIEEVAKEIVTNNHDNVQAPAPLENVVAQNNPLNDYMKQGTRENFYEKLSKTIEQKETLSHKMEHTSIPDLKRAISLNQRFQFSKELFKGNNQEYEVAIEKLNTTTREEAMKQLENLRNKYQWNETSSVTSDFKDLVERRYL